MITLRDLLLLLAYDVAPDKGEMLASLSSQDIARLLVVLCKRQGQKRRPILKQRVAEELQRQVAARLAELEKSENVRN